MDILFLLSLFAIKHWLFDFVWQTAEEIKHKGTYLDYRGMVHSIKHGIATFVIVKIAGLHFAEAGMIGGLDFLVHYHIDWAKMNINRIKGWGPTTHEQFWWLTGFDQFLHQITYLLLIWLVV